MNGTAIEVKSLRKTYRNGWFNRHPVMALREVSFSVEPGSIFGLLGPNGAGKTTLIKVLLGLVRRTGGDASLLGRSAGDRQGRTQVGYLPEDHRIPRHLTGNSALTYYGGLSGLSVAEVRQRRDALLERVGLGKWGKTSVKKYSKGMQQRLGLAQALMHDPDLVILDEPTDGLDPVGRTEVRAMLEQLKQQGKTVFLNSHLLQEVELVCDRVAILVDGSLRRVGSVDELTQRVETEVTFELVGSEPDVRAVLGDALSQGWETLAPNHFRITLRLGEQSAVDRRIDELRRKGVSVIGLSRQRDTLERAFLNIVTTPHSELS